MNLHQLKHLLDGEAFADHYIKHHKLGKEKLRTHRKKQLEKKVISNTYDKLQSQFNKLEQDHLF